MTRFLSYSAVAAIILLAVAAGISAARAGWHSDPEPATTPATSPVTPDRPILSCRPDGSTIIAPELVAAILADQKNGAANLATVMKVCKQ